MDQHYASRSFWLGERDYTPSPPLEGHQRADVAIVGGGYTGLWTAYYLKKADPSLDVAVVESQGVGYGASGRNGGFAMTLLDMSLHHLLRNHGKERAKAAHVAVADSVEEIGRVCAAESIDCAFTHGGLMVVATNAGQERRVRMDYEAAQEMGLDDFRLMTGEQARAEVNSPTYQMALFEEHCAILDPARLAWGLKDALVRLGVKVFEHSPVISVSTRPTSVETARGLLDAEHVVLAANAYAYAFPWLKHRLVPLYTYIVLTEPLTDTQWESVGWKNSQGIEDKRNYVHYYRPTPDGRISWGGSDGIVYFGAKAEPRHDRRASTFTRLAGTFRKTFPQLAGVKFTHAWGGPVAITADFLPAFGSLEGGKIHYGFGYCGHGVAPSNTGGQILRDLVLGRDTELANLVFVNRMPAAFPPEPIGWAGAELSRRALLRQDGKMDRGEPVGDMDPLILRILNKFS